MALLTRKPRGVQITQPGLILLEHARRCLASLEQAHADLAPFVGGHRAQLVIMANSNALGSYLPSDLQSFLVEHPGIRVALAERTSAEIAAAVAGGRADLGIGVWDSEHQALEFTPYKTDELVLIVPNSHPLASKDSVRFNECANEPFVCLQSDSAIHMFMVKLAHELGHRLDVRVQVSRFGTVAGLVAAGVGIGIIPRSIFLDAGKGFQAVKLDEPWAARRLSVCVRCDIGAATPPPICCAGTWRSGAAPSDRSPRRSPLRPPCSLLLLVDPEVLDLVFVEIHAKPGPIRYKHVFAVPANRLSHDIFGENLVDPYGERTFQQFPGP